MIPQMVRQECPKRFLGHAFLLGKQIEVDAVLCRDVYMPQGKIGLYEVVGQLKTWIPSLEKYVDVGAFYVYYKNQMKVRCLLLDCHGNFRSTGPVTPANGLLEAGWTPEELWHMFGGSYNV